jgi:hypothetical protein
MKNFQTGSQKFERYISGIADDMIGCMMAKDEFGVIPPHHGIEINLEALLRLRKITLAEWFARRGFKLYAPK